MLTSTAVAHYGSQAKLAKALGITRAAVSLWGEIVPEGSAYKLESLTGGALRVDSSRYLRGSARAQRLARLQHQSG